MMALFRKLAADREGVAVVEFALWTTMLFMVVLAGLDFGGYFLQRGKLNEAISAAAVQSFKQQQSGSVNFDALSDYVRNIADSQSVTVSTRCNGGNCTNLNRECACLQSNGSFFSKTCGESCSAGATANSTAGYYLTINASDPFRRVLLPKGVFVGDTVSESVTVRLE